MSEPDGAVGHVYRLHRKPETPGERGLPKQPVAEARVTPEGLEGDHNVYRHDVAQDDPAMAVLIMPLEAIQQLNREGWPVRPGDLGENVTTVGVPYDWFVPGLRVRVGEILLEVSKACTPCDNLYLLPYVGTERGPEFLKVMLDRRGWYARVVEGGRVRTGDRIEGAS
ncbi:MAG: MOSC domain-containing protein [Thermoplasmata archaeon]